MIGGVHLGGRPVVRGRAELAPLGAHLSKHDEQVIDSYKKPIQIARSALHNIHLLGNTFDVNRISKLYSFLTPSFVYYPLQN